MTPSVKLPGKFFELNVDKGVFVGGVGNSFKQLFLGILPNFRGCMDSVWFNGVEIFNLPGPQQRVSQPLSTDGQVNRRLGRKLGTDMFLLFCSLLFLFF